MTHPLKTSGIKLISFQVSRERPIERCLECGNVVKLNYVGPEEDHSRACYPTIYSLLYTNLQ